jgi:glycosyltransferase involved in cell wall biosynthesis
VKLRVVEVLPTLRRAGAENMAVALACGLPRGSFEAAVVSLYDTDGEGLETVLAEQGIRTWHLGKRPGFDVRMWPRLKRVFREFDPDLVHTHSYVLRYVRRLARPAAVVHTLHNLAGRDPDRITAWLNGFAFRRGVVPVAVSGAVARSFEAMYGMAPPATIPNGIDIRRFDRPEARLEWRRAHGFSNADILIASVARLEPQKDPEALIRAFAGIRSAGAPCHLLLAGDGSLRDSARKCAEHCQVGERVRFLGVLADVPELLCASDLFALASRWEGNPLSVMEAMAAGLPVVATAVGGVPELVEDGVTGLLVPRGDAEALERALAAVVGDAARRRAMGEAGRTRASASSVEAMVATYSELFLRLTRRPE